MRYTKIIQTTENAGYVLLVGTHTTQFMSPDVPLNCSDLVEGCHPQTYPTERKHQNSRQFRNRLAHYPDQCAMHGFWGMKTLIWIGAERATTSKALIADCGITDCCRVQAIERNGADRIG